MIAAVLAQQQSEEFSLWPENWPVFEMFLRLQTQWRVAAGLGGLMFVGLDYAAARWLFEVHDVADPAAMLDDLAVIERAALAALNERAGDGA